MADIIPFPAARQATLAPASAVPAEGVSAAGVSAAGVSVAGISAEVYQLPAPAAPTNPAVGADAPAALDTLVAQMRADSQALVRCMAELQGAVHDLVEADLPGQARALVAAAHELTAGDPAGVPSGPCRAPRPLDTPIPAA